MHLHHSAFLAATKCFFTKVPPRPSLDPCKAHHPRGRVGLSSFIENVVSPPFRVPETVCPTTAETFSLYIFEISRFITGLRTTDEIASRRLAHVIRLRTDHSSHHALNPVCTLTLARHPCLTLLGWNKHRCQARRRQPYTPLASILLIL